MAVRFFKALYQKYHFTNLFFSSKRIVPFSKIIAFPVEKLSFLKLVNLLEAQSKCHK